MSTQTALSIAPQSKDILTESDLDILRRTLFKGFTDDEVRFCVNVSNLVSLNPLLKQIHFVKRRNKDGTYSISVQTGIDGFRLTAQRTGEYAGSDEPVFEMGPDKKRPLKAIVTVYRMVAGQRCAFTASARWDEYYVALGGFWDRMPFNQLAKCAESLALRKAFPAELSILRSDEEMGQADNPSKADAIKEQIASQSPTVEVESVPLDDVGEYKGPLCPHCESANVMESKQRIGTMWCRACRKSFT